MRTFLAVYGFAAAGAGITNQDSILFRTDAACWITVRPRCEYMHPIGRSSIDFQGWMNGSSPLTFYISLWQSHVGWTWAQRMLCTTYINLNHALLSTRISPRIF